MTPVDEFEEIRPYTDAEVPEVMKRLMQNPLLYKLLKYLFPKASKERLVLWGGRVRTVRDLQTQFSHLGIRSIVNQTASGLTFDGFEHLEPDGSYLFISNHRDILLDSGILNVLLVEHGLETCETGAGDNLLISDLIADLMRINRSYTIHRNASRSQLYGHSLRLSRYIRQQLTQKNVSVWIAQRNGRTKDGLDKTDTGLLKMLGMSEPDFVTAFEPLHIIPMGVSYEYDPCDNLKAKERYVAESGDSYVKSRKDDLKSMLAGVTDKKGRIHLSIGKPLKHEIKELKDITPKNEQFRQFAHMLDVKIRERFHLWPTHYIGADLLAGEDTYADHYSAKEKAQFESYISQRLVGIEGDKTRLRELMLEIYANPVIHSPK